MNKLIYSPLATNAIALGRKEHMVFTVRGQGEVPAEPVYKDGWWFETLKSHSNIPLRGRQRLQFLKKAGVPIKGVVIAHEAPKLLTAPKPPPRPIERPIQKPTVELDALLQIVTAFFMFFGQLFVYALMIDPALIVVLEDGTWVEVYSWVE